MPDMKEVILSNDYWNFIFPIGNTPEDALQDFNLYPQILNRYFTVLHWDRGNISSNTFREYLFNYLPKVYTLMDITSLGKSGVLQVRSSPGLGLTGRNVLMGFIDTGIDYAHPAFRDSSGNTRIEYIWDQSIQTGTPPAGYFYGSEYTKEEIQEALRSSDPYEIVPSRDMDGHGTYMAGAAAGSTDEQNDFEGVAPQSRLVIVKLKQAKPYLLDFYQLNGSVPMFQEDDIMLAISYLLHIAQELRMPLVICLGLGSNQGAHIGDGPLAYTLDNFKTYQGICVVTAGGNEANRAHHFSGHIQGSADFQEVEIQVPGDSPGFTMEFWGQPPSIFSVGVVSPLGEVVERIPARFSQSQEISFILENTSLFIYYGLVALESGGEVIFFQFRNPTEGIWRIRVYCNNYTSSYFHMWLPITGMVSPDITFLHPSPYQTIVSPGNTVSIITTAAYQVTNDSLYIHSSRGFTPINDIKPEITAPGVDITVPRLRGGYTSATGSSIAAAFTAGCAALMVEWGMAQTPKRYFNTSEVKAYLIRGARRSPSRTYPNREWGFGILDIFQVFSIFLSP